jgi:hypothetical protein
LPNGSPGTKFGDQLSAKGAICSTNGRAVWPPAKDTREDGFFEILTTVVAVKLEKHQNDCGLQNVDNLVDQKKWTTRGTDLSKSSLWINVLLQKQF